MNEETCIICLGGQPPELAKPQELKCNCKGYFHADCFNKYRKSFSKCPTCSFVFENSVYIPVSEPEPVYRSIYDRLFSQTKLIIFYIAYVSIVVLVLAFSVDQKESVSVWIRGILFITQEIFVVSSCFGLFVYKQHGHLTVFAKVYTTIGGFLEFVAVGVGFISFIGNVKEDIFNFHTTACLMLMILDVITIGLCIRKLINSN